MKHEIFRAVFSGPLIGNLGYTLETAEAAIRHGWPLAAHSDPSTWYRGDSGAYTNFPAYEL